MSDDGRLPGMLGVARITGDGLPTGTTTLVEQGRLVGFLADAYHAQHLTGLVGAVVPRNGMRHATNGQSFAMRPGIFPTNITFSSPDAVALDALLAPIDQGLYVGDLWHITTPEGLRTGAFTSTVIGPSYAIRQGQLAEPVRPGTLSLQDNFLTSCNASPASPRRSSPWCLRPGNPSSSLPSGAASRRILSPVSSPSGRGLG